MVLSNLCAGVLESVFEPLSCDGPVDRKKRALFAESRAELCGSKAALLRTNLVLQCNSHHFKTAGIAFCNLERPKSKSSV